MKNVKSRTQIAKHCSKSTTPNAMKLFHELGKNISM